MLFFSSKLLKRQCNRWVGERSGAIANRKINLEFYPEYYANCIAEFHPLTLEEVLNMACIVYRTNKKSGITYAFRQESYRDPVTRKPRNTKTYLGRVDPETNTIIEKKTRSSNEPSEENSKPKQNYKSREEILLEKKDAQIQSLQEEIKAKDKRIQSLIKSLEKLKAFAASAIEES